jgi:hypothetical protein
MSLSIKFDLDRLMNQGKVHKKVHGQIFFLGLLLSSSLLETFAIIQISSVNFVTRKAPVRSADCLSWLIGKAPSLSIFFSLVSIVSRRMKWSFCQGQFSHFLRCNDSLTDGENSIDIHLQFSFRRRNGSRASDMQTRSHHTFRGQPAGPGVGSPVRRRRRSAVAWHFCREERRSTPTSAPSATSHARGRWYGGSRIYGFVRSFSQPVRKTVLKKTAMA